MSDSKNIPDPLDGLEPGDSLNPLGPLGTTLPAGLDQPHDFIVREPVEPFDLLDVLTSMADAEEEPTDAFDTHEPTNTESIDVGAALTAAGDEPVNPIDALAHYRGEPDVPDDATGTLDSLEVDPRDQI